VNNVAKSQKLTSDAQDVRGCIQKFPDCILARELQMVQLSTTRCSCIANL
jgi:hypothetical protein